MSMNSVLHLTVQISGAFAVLLNTFLVYVLVKFSNKTIGFYKWLLVTYAVYEVLYAAVVIVTVPTHTIVDDSWVVFTFGGFVDPSSSWGPGLYCGFYLLWIYHLSVMFIYRYVVVTKEKWTQTIQRSTFLQCLLGGIYILQVAYCFTCGLFFCTQNPMTKKMEQELMEKFQMFRPGFIELDYRSFFGILSFTDHHILLLQAFIVIPFCGVKMWRQIVSIQKESSTIEVRISRQIMVTLIVQTAMPLVLYIFPSLFLFSFPIWPKGVFGVIPHLLSVFTTFPKIMDPILVILCVQDYRHATFNIFQCIPWCRQKTVAPLTTTAILGNTTVTEKHSSYVLNP